MNLARDIKTILSFLKYLATGVVLNTGLNLPLDVSILNNCGTVELSRNRITAVAYSIQGRPYSFGGPVRSFF